MAMTLGQVMTELEARGSEQVRKIFRNHGASEPMFGVLVAELKKLLKKTGPDHALALQLWETGNYDARYLAGLMADAQAVTTKQLDHWADTAASPGIAEYAVAGVAAESPHGAGRARKWIESKRELTADAGWATWSGVVTIVPDEELDLGEIGALLDRVEKTLHDERNRVRYTMNGFVIAVGSHVAPHHERAMAVAERLGKIHVEMGNTACKVPPAGDYIAKVVARQGVGSKRRAVRC